MRSEKDLLIDELLSVLFEEGITTKTNYYLVSLIYNYVSENKMIKFLDDKLNLKSKEITEQINEDVTKKVNNLLENYNLEEIRNSIYNILSRTKFDRHLIESSNNYICKLVYKLLEIGGDGSIVLDLGSGVGNFLANIYRLTKEDGHVLKDLIGVEINHEEALISQIALDILFDSYNRPMIINTNGLDAIDHPYNKGYVFPPFGLRNNIDEELTSKLFKDIKFTFRNTGEWTYVDTLLAGILEPNNKAVALVTGRALFNDADMEYRNALIKNGLLEGIIELPAGSLSYTAIKVFMLVFSSNNKEVKFVDASTLVSADNKRYVNLELPVDEIYNLYNSKTVKTINNEDLIDKTNLSPSVNLLEVKEIKNGVILSDCAEVITGNQYTLGIFEKKGLLSEVNTGYRILTSSDIDNGHVDLNSLKFVDFKDDKFDKFRLHKGDLIITGKSSKIKTVVIDEEPKEKVIVTGGMLIVRIKERINPTYLKVFLDSKEGQNVLKSIQKGIAIVTINASSLASITIPLVSEEEQQKIARNYNDLLDKYTKLKIELNALEEEINNFSLDI